MNTSTTLITTTNHGDHDAAASFGPHWDQRCGEQFFHIPRMIATKYLSGERDEEDDLKWTHRGDFAEQVAWYRQVCADALPRYERLADDCERTALNASNSHAARLIRDTVGLQAVIYCESVHGSLLACTAVQEGIAKDYKRAFYHVGCAKEHFTAGNAAMRAREHGVWEGYWSNDCLTDVKQSAQIMGLLMGYLRNRGDGPHYFWWKHEFRYAEQWKDVIVLLNVENHESDDEMFQIMKHVWPTRADERLATRTRVFTKTATAETVSDGLRLRPFSRLASFGAVWPVGLMTYCLVGIVRLACICSSRDARYSRSFMSFMLLATFMLLTRSLAQDGSAGTIEAFSRHLRTGGIPALLSIERTPVASLNRDATGVRFADCWNLRQPSGCA